MLRLMRLRSSCIDHPPHDCIIIRSDYVGITRDTCAAALLFVFECWADNAADIDPSLRNALVIPVGKRTVRGDFIPAMENICSPPPILQRLNYLEFVRLIICVVGKGHRNGCLYHLNVSLLNDCLNGRATILTYSEYDNQL